MDKQDKITQTEISQKQKEVTLPKESLIAYTGSVKVKYIDKNGRRRTIKKHNNGKPGLFTYIVHCLAGNPINIYRPSKLMAYTTTEKEGDQKVLTTPISYQSTPKLYNGDDVLTNPEGQANKLMYTFLIPNSALQVTTGTIDKLHFLNNVSVSGTETSYSDIQICAEIELKTDEEKIQLGSGSNILIYWTMEFGAVLPETSTNENEQS